LQGSEIASAGERSVTEHHHLVFLLQVLLLLGLARGLGEVLRHWGHPPLVGEILVGICLGPTLLGRFAPALQLLLFPDDVVQRTMLETVSWFGVLFLLLETGLEVDVSAAWRQRGPALRVGIIGVLIPLMLGFLLSLGLPDHYLADPAKRVVFALFLGTAMSISAVAVIARVLHDLDLVKSDLGLLTLCGYAINDLMAWVILSLLLAFASQAVIAWRSLAFFLLTTVLFTAGCLTLGRRMVDEAIAAITRNLPQQPGAVLSFVCCLGLLGGCVTQGMGLNAPFGFFIAGMMAGEARALSERTRQILSQMVHAVFVPLYFAAIGLRLDFLTHFDVRLVAFVVLVSILGKFLGAWSGTLGTGLSRDDRLSMGIAFTPGGVADIILARVALESRIFTEPVFVAVVAAAMVSSLLVGPLLLWSIQRRKEIHILEFFLRRAVIPNLRGTTRDEVIQELCATVADHHSRLDRETLTAAVRAREDLMGTGVGNGVAIPHARFATLTKPVLTFGRSVAGVEWDTPDGLPAHFIFLLLTPVVDEGLQLQSLAALARGMSNENARMQLTQANTSQEVWQALQDVLGTQKVARGKIRQRDDKGM
jgi:Kef-type K+ transport system membrane component KefB